MNITCDMVNRMTPQEKEIYFAHIKKDIEKKPRR